MDEEANVSKGITGTGTDEPSPPLKMSDSQWAGLIGEVSDSMSGGVIPESERARALALRWMRLLREEAESASAIGEENLHVTGEMRSWIVDSFFSARMALLARHLSPPEVEVVRAAQIAHLSEWPPLVAAMRAKYESGAKVGDPAVQELAGRWENLFRASYCGDDRALEDKVRAAFLREPDLTLGLGIELGLSVFVLRAIIYSHRPKQESSDAGPKPSALAVAKSRAVHQLLDTPLILDDPLALTILGKEEESRLRTNPEQYNDPMAKILRTSVVVRTRFAEDEWEVCAEKGVRQHVILGAGLDTYAYRCRRESRIFEVDLPDTQQWKRDRLLSAGIPTPDCLTYVPINIDQASPAQSLGEAGFRTDAPAFFSWLGVVFYLEKEAVLNTLQFIASCAPGTVVVFDHMIPPSQMSHLERIGLEVLSSALAEQGEHFKTFLDPATLAETLLAMGFGEVRSLGPQQLKDRYLFDRTDGLRVGGATRLVHAVV